MIYMLICRYCPRDKAALLDEVRQAQADEAAAHARLLAARSRLASVIDCEYFLIKDVDNDPQTAADGRPVARLENRKTKKSFYAFADEIFNIKKIIESGEMKSNSEIWNEIETEKEEKEIEIEERRKKYAEACQDGAVVCYNIHNVK